MALGQRIDCFTWQNHLSAFLDGDLSDPDRKSAEEHLSSCKKCTERNKHYRLVLSTLGGMPRAALPTPLKKAPLSLTIPRMEAARMGRSRWDQVPWYLRVPLEGTGIVLIVLLGITAAPRVRKVYETSLERSLLEFTEGLSNGEFSFRSATRPPLPQTLPQTSGTNAEPGADTQEDTPPVPAPYAAKTGPVKVGKGELWRFIVKTESLEETGKKVTQILLDLKLPKDTPGINGESRPFVINFDLEVPSSVVSDLKVRLEELAPSGPSGAPFTWFKVKWKRKLPPDYSRVAIFVQQY